MRKARTLFALAMISSLGLSGCGGYDGYGGSYYGYPGGWGRQGWNGGYSVGPHYTGRGWGGRPGYRQRYDDRRGNRGQRHGDDDRNHGGDRHHR